MAQLPQAGPVQQAKNTMKELHVRGDSDSDLEALFSIVMNPQEGQPAQVPLRMRKLPASFFNPPEPNHAGSPHHSRQGSSDSQGHFAHMAQGSPHMVGLSINHQKSLSSPATLQQTFSVHNPQVAAIHNRQTSYEIGDDISLPPGWEQAKTPRGERYYLNHSTQTTTWQDPRLTRSQSNSSVGSAAAASPHQQASPAPSLNNLGPMPPGWEQAVTPEGEMYYINHVEKHTTWFDPRIPPHMQRPGLKLNSKAPAPSPPGMPTGGPGAQSPPQGAPPPPPPSQMHISQLKKVLEEKQRLQKQQEELAKREQMIRQSLGGRNEVDPNAAAMLQHLSIQQQNIASDISKNGVDPFLGGGHSELHSRQESSDSGLGVCNGGGGTSGPGKLGGMNAMVTQPGPFNMPRNPEDYLAKVDDMDTSENTKVVPDSTGTTDFNMGLNTESQMDSEDLMPSIPNDLANDLLLDSVLTPNNNNLLGDTWL